METWIICLILFAGVCYLISDSMFFAINREEQQEEQEIKEKFMTEIANNPDKLKSLLKGSIYEDYTTEEIMDTIKRQGKG